MQLQSYYAQDANGNIIPGAPCSLFLAGTETLATGLQDANGDPLGNPFTAAANGMVSVAAPQGLYDLFIESGLRSGRIRLQFIDVEQVAADASSAAASAVAAADSATVSQEANATLVYVDGTPLSVTYPNQFIERDDILYRLKPSEVTPLVLSGVWATDELKLISLGEAGLRADLLSPSGAEDVFYGAESVATTLTKYASPLQHLRSFGAKLDGVHDDSDAVEAAIASGVPLMWGRQGDNIRITRRISVTSLGPVNWVSYGANIIFDSPSVTLAHALDVDILGGVRHKISGQLNINGSDKCSVGLRLFNRAEGFPAAYAYADISGLSVKNIFRSSNLADGGDGIILRGAFRCVNIDLCTVENVHMAAGAGIVGSVGVTGITVAPQMAGYSIMTNCSRLTINGIKSDDPTVRDDQDGLRVFSGWATRSGKSENIFNCTDSQFTDCYGRSIKAQTEAAFISKCKFAAYGGPNLGRNQDVDLQVGCGVVRDCTAYYANQASCPDSTIAFQPAPDWESFSGTACDIKVFIASGTLSSVVGTYPRARTQHLTTVQGIDVIGAIDVVVEGRVWSNLSNFSVEKCTVNNIATGLVRITASGAGGSPYGAFVSIDDCTNLGTSRPLVIDSVAGFAAKALVSSGINPGFATSLPINDASPKGGIKRMPYRTGMGAITGTDYVDGTLLAAGATWDLGVPGYSGRGKLDVASSSSILAQGQVAFSSTGATRTLALTTAGTALVVGNTTQPGTGEIQVWFDTTLKIRNNTAGNVVLTINILG